MKTRIRFERSHLCKRSFTAIAALLLSLASTTACFAEPCAVRVCSRGDRYQSTGPTTGRCSSSSGFPFYYRSHRPVDVSNCAVPRSFDAVQGTCVLSCGCDGAPSCTGQSNTELYWNGCHWDGTAPFCAGRCTADELQVGERDRHGMTSRGRGNRCISGYKRFCCRQSVAITCFDRTIHDTVTPGPGKRGPTRSGEDFCAAGEFLGTAAPVLSSTADNTWRIRCCVGARLFKVINGSTGKKLAVEGASLEAGGRIVVWEDFGQPDVVWELIGTANGVILRNRNSHLVLAVAGASRREGANVIQTVESNQWDTQWRVIGTPDGHHKLVNYNSGQVLALGAGETVVQRTDRGEADTVWTLTPVP